MSIQTADENTEKLWLDVIRLVGDLGIEHFKDVGRHLAIFPTDPIYKLRLETLPVRFAPSMVARGEVQLFSNLDIPRFAFRVYLGIGESTSFVNLRRLKEVESSLKSAEWLPPEEAYLGDLRQQLEELRESAGFPIPSDADIKAHQDRYPINIEPSMWNSVADGVIVPTRKNHILYWIATSDFGWVSGEGQPYNGVFYVTSLVEFLSGATCAPACATMVSAHLSAAADAWERHAGEPTARVAPGVHCLAEIPSITTEERFRHIRLEGATELDLARYFSKLRKRTFIHLNAAVGSEQERQQASNQVVTNTIDSACTYIRSGFQSILFVRDDTKSPLPDHAVVVVGVVRETTQKNTDLFDKKAKGRIFYVNDPSRFPLDGWTREKLTCQAVFEFSRSAETMEVGRKDFLTRQLVVVPEEIKVPYSYCTSTADGSGSVLGIREMVDKLNPPDQTGSTFTLGRIGLDRKDKNKGLFYSSRHLADFCGANFFLKWANPVPALESLQNRWIWFERLPDPNRQIRMWDAEKEPLTRKDDLTEAAVNGYILAEGNMDPDGSWNFRLPSHLEPKADTLLPKYGRVLDSWNPGLVEQSMLDVGLITSVRATTLRESLRDWPSAVNYGDLYAFMHRDEDVLKPIWDHMGLTNPLDERPSAVEALAKAFVSKPPHELLSSVARAIEKVREETQPKVKFRAMATFMCGLFSRLDRKHEHRKKAINALCFCAKLAQQLNHQHGHDIRVIEIVGGSRIDGVISLPYMPQNTGVPRARAYALRVPFPEMISRIKEGLFDLCKQKMEMDIDRENKVVFAIELEPGPLFAFNGKEALTAVKDVLHSEGIRGHVGLNIDIAHCVLSGLSPDDLFGSEEMRDLIYHFHISDHGAGHFADTVIGDCGFNACVSTDDDKMWRFQEWIRRARVLAQERKTAKTDIPFSGMVSVELEGAGSKDDIANSCELLGRLLRCK